MKNITRLILISSAIFLFFYGCESDVNTPDENDSLTDQLSFQTVDSDLALMKNGGMSLDRSAGVFSIGWNEMFRPMLDSSKVKGMSFAVAFGDRETDLRHFKRFGLNMGSIFINYPGNQIEMFKHFHRRLGYAYSLFERPFGNSTNLLQFIPNTEYQFDVTGSEAFAPITITLTSPAALMDITGPDQGTIIDPEEDLTITWVGGNEGKVGIRLMPHIRPDRGRHHHPRFDRVIFIILDENTGTYTFPAEQIQRLLNGIDANGIRAEVSQMELGEVEHPNGTLHTAMRNGSSLMLRVE